MSPARRVATATAAFFLLAADSSHQERGHAVNRLSPIIVVDAIEPCLSFWTEGLGFEITGTVPHEDAMGFAMLDKGAVQVMYQSRASIDADIGASGAPEGLGTELAEGTTTLFIEVADIEPVIAGLGDQDVLVPRRQTFYGMDEIFYRAPCGTVVGFAAKIDGFEAG